MEPFGVQLAGGALVHVEITQTGVHRRVQQRRDRLVLQDVLVAVEVVDGVGWALLEAPEELVQGDRPHRAGKLPPREGGRKARLTTRGGGPDPRPPLRAYVAQHTCLAWHQESVARDDSDVLRL